MRYTSGKDLDLFGYRQEIRTQFFPLEGKPKMPKK